MSPLILPLGGELKCKVVFPRQYCMQLQIECRAVINSFQFKMRKAEGKHLKSVVLSTTSGLVPSMCQKRLGK